MASPVNVADHESVEENTLDKVGELEIDGEGKVPVCTYGFDIQDRLTDLTLIVEDIRLYVNRGVLEVSSSVLRDMFESKLKGKEVNEVEIPDVNYKEFAEFLACMYPTKEHRVSQSNVLTILPLVFHYKVNFLMNESVVVLTWVTSQTEDEEYLIRCLETAKRFGLTTLRQHCFDLVVKKRRENCQTLDDKMDADDKVAIFDELMPHLRSEVCKIKFLSSDTENNEVLFMANFSNAKYKKEEFSFHCSQSNNIAECLTTEVWDLKLIVTVESKCITYRTSSTSYECNLILTLDPPSLPTKLCYVAIKFVLQNIIPGKQNMCLQKQDTMVQGSKIIVPLQWNTITNIENGFQSTRW